MSDLMFFCGIAFFLSMLIWGFIFNVKNIRPDLAWWHYCYWGGVLAFAVGMDEVTEAVYSGFFVLAIGLFIPVFHALPQYRNAIQPVVTVYTIGICLLSALIGMCNNSVIGALVICVGGCAGFIFYRWLRWVNEWQ